MKLFKIRNRQTGLFSTGGSSPRWEENGKLWKKKGFVTNHLANAIGYDRAKGFYGNAEVVEYDYDPVEIATYPIMEVINEKIDLRKKEAEASKARYEKYKYEEALKVVNNYKG